MPRRFQFSSNHPGDRESWFRIGSLDITTTTLVTIMSVAGFFTYLFGGAIAEALILYPHDVRSGQLWRLVTWPIANYPDIWTVLNLFFFWYFGSELERTLGRDRFARFLLWLTLALGLLALGLSTLFWSGRPVLAGIGAVELVVVLLFIAENPHVRFFFNIPGWVIGAVLVALPVLQLLTVPDLLGLLNLLLGLAIAAVLARQFGLLAEHAWLPAVRRRPRRPRARSARKRPATPGTVTQGPWLSAGRAGSDQARLDALLDKISESGIESLSSRERDELMELRRRLRGG